jgi:predicted PurR-regulated permease PerM
LSQKPPVKEAAETDSARPEAARAAPPGSRAEMPPWIPRLIFTVILSVFAAVATFEVVRRLRDLIVWLVIALFLSFALEPAVDWLSERGWRRGIATAATLLGLFLVGVVLIAAMTPLVIQQVQGLIGNVPGWLDRVSVYTHRFLRIDVSTARIVGQLRNLDASVASYARNLAGNLLGFGAAVLEAVFRLFTIGLFTFYLVADGPRFRRVVCSLLRPERQRDVLWAWDVAIKRTGGYLYSRLLLATISGVATFVVLSLTGVAFAAPLALWMGVVSQFIPVVGTYVAMSVPLLVALLDRPVAAVVLAVFFLVYQQVENYFLSPRITARTMQLHPAVAFGAVLAGGSLLGAVGAFLALPAAAILQAGLSTYVRRHEVMETDLTREQTPVSPRARPRRWILGRRSSG